MTITKSQLEKMTIKELIEFLNNCVTDITDTNIHASFIKNRMFERVRDVFAPEFLLQDTNYMHHDFSIPIKGLSIQIKIGTKSTGEIQQVTRLKSKNVVGVGKFRVDDINFRYSIPCFEIEDEDKFLVKVDSGWASGGETVWLPNDPIKTFEEMGSRENKYEAILAQYKLVEETNKKYNKTSRVYSSLEEEIALSAAQVFIKVAYFSNSKEKDLIKKLPKELQAQVKSGETNWFEAAIKVVQTNNQELIKKIIEQTL